MKPDAIAAPQIRPPAPNRWDIEPAPAFLDAKPPRIPGRFSAALGAANLRSA